MFIYRPRDEGGGGIPKGTTIRLQFIIYSIAYFYVWQLYLYLATKMYVFGRIRSLHDHHV